LRNYRLLRVWQQLDYDFSPSTTKNGYFSKSASIWNVEIPSLPVILPVSEGMLGRGLLILGAGEQELLAGA
jgi:hypothetical protein